MQRRRGIAAWRGSVVALGTDRDGWDRWDRIGYKSESVGSGRVRIGIVGIKWGSFLFAYPATGTKMDACGGICSRIGRI